MKKAKFVRPKIFSRARLKRNNLESPTISSLKPGLADGLSAASKANNANNANTDLNPADLSSALDPETVYLKPRNKAIYLLPNAFTTAALFFGFFSIVQAMNQRWEMAAIAIFCSLVLDGMDGRVARMTNTQSAFGEQYDSLADMVSFGVAPALVAYEWALKGMGKWGWLAAFIYCAGAALRLARFNISTTIVDKRFFQGLPSPAAASIIAGFVWLVEDNQLSVNSYAIPWVMFFLTIYAGTTMVSNVLFYSGKALDIKYKVPFGFMVLLILGFALVSSNPPIILFLVFVLYAMSGYLRWFWLFFKAKKVGAKPIVE